jgi:hypothetical protein
MNRFTGFEAFLARWRGDSRGGAEEAPLVRESPLGNRNVRGSALDTEAYSYVPSQNGFSDALEPGIRELVLFLVNRMRVITYSSCQGHPASQGAPFRAAHVGILSDVEGVLGDAADGDALLHLLELVAARSMQALDEPWLGVRAVAERLDTDVGPRRCVDVWFLPIRGSEADYFRELPGLLMHFQRTLEQTLDDLRQRRAGAEALVSFEPHGGP